MVASAPSPVKTGGVVSSIVMVWDTGVAALPAQSIAVQVLVTVPTPHASRVVTSEKLITTAGSQLSLTVGAVKDAVAGHSMVASAPSPLNTGGVVSSIVIVCETGVAALPAQSIAVQVLVTVPTPHASRVVTSEKLITTAGSQLSLTVGAVKDAVAGHSMVASAPSPVKTGGVVSSIVMVWETGVAALPAQSIAVQVLVTVPTPHASRVVTSEKLITTAGSQLSLTVGAVKDAVAGHSMVASAPSPVKTGGVVSSIVMV